MVRITAHLEVMACGMCEAHINEAVRNGFRWFLSGLDVDEKTAAKDATETG